MANIVGGVATSHTPTIAFAKDAKQVRRPGVEADLRGLRAGAGVVSREEARRAGLYLQRPHDLVLRPLQPLRAGRGRRVHGPADEGGGPRDIPAIKGDPKFAAARRPGRWSPTNSTCRYFQGKGLDHGAFSPLSVMVDYDESGWACKLLPIVCGVLTVPLPSARRFYKFGKSLRQAILSYPEDIKVAIAGTGGLSHQVHGEGCGFNNPEWDMEFMERLEKDPESLLDMTDRQTRQAGRLGRRRSGHVADDARRARRPKSRCTHKTYFLPSMSADRDDDLRGKARRRAGRRADRGPARAAGSRLEGAEEARGNLSLHHRAQRQGLPPQPLPPLADRARRAQAVPRGRGSGDGAGRPDRRREEAWSANATGSA